MSTENTTRGARKVRKGVVVSKSGAKTVKVRVSYREIHPMYGKVVTRTKNYHAHDEADDAKVGDTVTLFGRDGNDEITVDSLAKRLDTINYELVCIIGKRVTRVFKSGGETVAVRSLIGSN